MQSNHYFWVQRSQPTFLMAAMQEKLASLSSWHRRYAWSGGKFTVCVGHGDISVNTKCQLERPMSVTILFMFKKFWTQWRWHMRSQTWVEKCFKWEVLVNVCPIQATLTYDNWFWTICRCIPFKSNVYTYHYILVIVVERANYPMTCKCGTLMKNKNNKTIFKIVWPSGIKNVKHISLTTQGINQTHYKGHCLKYFKIKTR